MTVDIPSTHFLRAVLPVPEKGFPSVTPTFPDERSGGSTRQDQPA
jgi:hypothetical protein